MAKNEVQKNDLKELKKEDIAVVDTKTARQAAFGAALGNAMEWFDFGIYSYLAVTIGKVFFPESDPATQLVSTFATFAVAFIARPIGAIFFGRLGDRLGRKAVLTMTLILMAIGTFSIGLIPSYESIGLTAAILLLFARLVQGFSTGGEYAGAMTYITESSPDKKRGMLSSLLEAGTLIGFILGAGLVTILTEWLGPETMSAWGWRIPFFVAAPLGLIAVLLRSRLKETPAFSAMEEGEQEKEKVPFKDLFLHWRPMLIGLGLVFFYNVIDYMILSYMPSYLSAVLGYGETKGLLLILMVMFVMIPIVILMGYLSDRLGHNIIIRSGLVGIVLISIPAFWLIGTGNSFIIFLGLAILGFLLATFQGTMPSTLPSLFFTPVRYSALALTYNVSTSIFGGTTPLVLAWLNKLTHDPYVPAYVLIVTALIGLVVSLFLKETAQKPMRGSAPVVERPEEIGDVLKNPEEATWWEEEPEAEHLNLNNETSQNTDKNNR